MDFKYHYITYNPFSRDLYFFGKKGIKTSNKKNKEIKKEFNKLIKPAFVRHEGEKLRYLKLAWKILFKFPLFVLMYILPDPKYQNVRFTYSNNKKKLKNYIRSIFK